VIGRDEGVGKPDAHQPPEWRARGEAQRGFEHSDAGALAAHQCTRDVETVLGKQLVEVVSRHAARNARELLADERRVLIADRLEARVDLPFASAAANDRLELGVACRADGHSRAVVQHHVERVNVVDGFAAHERMDAARVVANHAAERAAAMRGRVGREGQLMDFGRVAHAIEHDARLDARDLPRRIERDDPVQEF
jgi:hypothetical protein